MNCRLSILLALCTTAVAPLCAQTAPPPPVQDAAPDPQLKQNPLEALRNFEPAADEEYRIGKGDEITIDFAGRSDLQAKLVVGPDGRVTLPLAGDILVANLTRPDAGKAIDAALATYYSNLSSQVTVTKYTANRILVLGDVEHPGELTFEGTPTLLEALTRGGLAISRHGATTAATESNKIAQVPERCAIYRGQDQVVWVDLKQLIESGNTRADLRLRRDDVIYVPDPAERFVSVLGQVQHPGAVPLTHNSTLASVLADAGGFTDKAGNKPSIQVVDPTTGKSRIYPFNDLLNPARASEIALKPGDLIFVPQSGFYRATYFLERLSPATSLATMAVLVGAP